MKKYLLTIAVFLLVMQGCKKEDTIPAFFGKWELTSSVMGFSGKSTSYAAGNGNIIQFDGNNYTIFRDGIVAKQGTYKIVDAEQMFNKEMGKQIVFDNNPDGREFITLKNKKLTIYHDVSDGGSATYIKID